MRSTWGHVLLNGTVLCAITASAQQVEGKKKAIMLVLSQTRSICVAGPTREAEAVVIKTLQSSGYGPAVTSMVLPRSQSSTRVHYSRKAVHRSLGQFTVSKSQQMTKSRSRHLAQRRSKDRLAKRNRGQARDRPMPTLLVYRRNMTSSAVGRRSASHCGWPQLLYGISCKHARGKSNLAKCNGAAEIS